MEYQIAKSLTGYAVKYACPGCGAGLKSALKKAGQQDTCPDCSTAFIVPGAEELAKLERKKQQAKDAKDQKRVQAKQQKEDERKEKLLNERKLKQQEESERKRNDLENKRRGAARKDAVSMVSFDVADHDWSMGGPFVYRCVEIGTVSRNWAGSLQDLINRQANEGWEYYRSESLVAERPGGCLAALLGQGNDRFNVVVVVFRKPTIVVKAERSV